MLVEELESTGQSLEAMQTQNRELLAQLKGQEESKLQLMEKERRTAMQKKHASEQVS